MYTILERLTQIAFKICFFSRASCQMGQILNFCIKNVQITQVSLLLTYLLIDFSEGLHCLAHETQKGIIKEMK
jgi:hypothetical protein